MNTNRKTVAYPGVFPATNTNAEADWAETCQIFKGML